MATVIFSNGDRADFLELLVEALKQININPNDDRRVTREQASTLTGMSIYQLRRRLKPAKQGKGQAQTEYYLRDVQKLIPPQLNTQEKTLQAFGAQTGFNQ